MLCSSVLLGELRTVLFAHIYPVCGSKVSRGCGMILITAGSVELRDLSACCYWMKEWKCRRDEIFAFPRFENVMILGSRYEEISVYTKYTSVCSCILKSFCRWWADSHTHRLTVRSNSHCRDLQPYHKCLLTLSDHCSFSYVCACERVCVCGWMS